MEVKKSTEANLERLRTPLFLIGLLFIGSVVLASFTYGTNVSAGDESDKNKRTANIETEKIKQDEKKEEDTPTPPQSIDVPPPPSELTVTKENTNDTVVKTVVAVQTDIKIDEVIVTNPVIEAEIIEFPDVEATFPGGAAALQKWIADNVQYPQVSQELGEQGKVYVSFVVEPDGKVSNVQVERGVSDDLDREAKRVVRNMPAWIPGEAGGKKSRTRCRLPIVFTLQ